MSYSLKSNALTSALTMCLAVDSDGVTIKEFVSADVNSNATIASGIQKGTATVAGRTATWFRSGENNIVFASGHRPAITNASPGFAFFASQAYSAGRVGSIPVLLSKASGGVVNGGFLAFSASTGNGSTSADSVAASYGLNSVAGSATQFYFGAAGSALAADGTGGVAASLTDVISAVGLSGNYNDGFYYIICTFNRPLTLSEFQSLHTDWFSALFQTATASVTVGGSAGSGTVGTAYSAQFTASGGTAPYTYSVGSGSLPTGTTLNTSSGLVSGTPTTAGTYGFVIHAVDSAAVAGNSASQSCVIAAASAGSLAVAGTAGAATVGTAYTAQFTASGGASPYTYSLGSGTLPTGVSLNASSGALSGTPTAAGTFAFVIHAVDSTSGTALVGNSAAQSVVVSAAASGGGAAGWLAGATPGVWLNVTSANLATMPGGASVTGTSGLESGAMLAWQGSSLDTRNSRQYFGPPGGHGDGSWNGVIVLDWLANAPQFAVAAAPSADANRAQDTAGFYPDGKPAASHTYSNLQYIEALNCHVRFNATGTWGDGQHGGSGLASLNTVSGAWDAANAQATNANPLTIYPDNICVKIGNEDVLMQQGYNLAVWRQSTKTWSGAIGTTYAHTGGRAAYDSRRNRVLVLAKNTGESTNPGAYLMDCASASFAQTRFPITGTIGGSAFDEANPPWGYGQGLVFVPHPTNPNQDRFLVYDEGSNGTVYAINALTGVITLAYTNTSSTAIPNGSAGNGAGVYSKFMYVPTLNGVALVTGVQGANNVWFLPLGAANVLPTFGRLLDSHFVLTNTGLTLPIF